MENFKYKRTTWVNNSEPLLDAEHLNNIEDGITHVNKATQDLKELILDTDSNTRQLISDTETTLNTKIDTVDKAVALKNIIKGEVGLKKALKITDTANHPLLNLKVYGGQKDMYVTIGDNKVKIPYTLNAIKVDSGGNCVDDDYQDWLADYIDFDKKVLVRVLSNNKKPLKKAKVEKLEENPYQEFKKLSTYYPSTLITADCTCIVEVKYVADTKNYVDDRIRELTNAILAQGGHV